jgi:hypothetical protein
MGPEPKKDVPIPDSVARVQRQLDLAREQVRELPSPTEREEKLRQTVAGLQDSMDELRLAMKCLIFDLEATRRERDLLQRENGELRRLSGGDNSEFDPPDGERE